MPPLVDAISAARREDASVFYQAFNEADTWEARNNRSTPAERHEHTVATDFDL